MVATRILTLPVLWDGNRTNTQNGAPIEQIAVRDKQVLEAFLQEGFLIKIAAPFTFNGVGYVHYVLERNCAEPTEQIKEVEQ